MPPVCSASLNPISSFRKTVDRSQVGFQNQTGKAVFDAIIRRLRSVPDQACERGFDIERGEELRRPGTCRHHQTARSVAPLIRLNRDTVTVGRHLSTVSPGL